jgi:uncharacterized membrane protein (DUF4010 family)
MHPLVDHDPELILDFLTALGIGLLIGLERERKPSAKAGLRTFAIVGVFGALCGALSSHLDSYWLLGVGLALVGLMIISAYLEDHGSDEDPGTTTSAALLVCFTLGAAVTLGFRQIAVMLGVVTTVLLYFKTELAGIAKGLERRELLSVLQFAVLTFVILPVLPDQAFGPYEAINPRNVWLMVVLISGLSLAGYLALRLVGGRRGLLLLGALGGLVSSTATTVVYSRHARAHADLADSAVVVILLANLVVVVRLAVLTWVTAPSVLPALLPVVGCALLAGSGGVAVLYRHMKREAEPPVPRTRNPTELKTAVGFAAVYAVVLVVAAWLHDLAGARGVYAVAAVSGLTDVDAITLSALRLHGMATISAVQATTAITVALVANIAFKLGLALVVGGAHLFRRCALPMLGVAVGAVAGWFLFA